MTTPATPPAASAARRRPYGNIRRVLYGTVWSFYTVLLLIGGPVGFAHGSIIGGLVSWALAALAGRYAWRIWTFKARWLWFILFF